ncbi:MAG: hypothetical protein KJO65_06570, partial [Gemmatimonadetes bacterium]|nr:hypothetical protein [Gemmatimonadota bacterium]
MTHLTPILALLALTLLGTHDLQAQFPPATPEQREAGARVTEVRFGTEELTIPRGETATIGAELFDADGNRVEGAVALVFAQGGVGPTFSA